MDENEVPNRSQETWKLIFVAVIFLIIGLWAGKNSASQSRFVGVTMASRGERDARFYAITDDGALWETRVYNYTYAYEKRFRTPWRVLRVDQPDSSE